MFTLTQQRELPALYPPWHPEVDKNGIVTGFKPFELGKWTSHGWSDVVCAPVCHIWVEVKGSWPENWKRSYCAQCAAVQLIIE